MERTQKSVKNTIFTPLGIISIFFSFTEIVLSYAVFNTHGGIQIALTVFVIVFPFYVAIMFFRVLWFKPVHLYPPSEFKKDDPFLAYHRPEIRKYESSQNHSISPIMNKDKFES